MQETDDICNELCKTMLHEEAVMLHHMPLSLLQQHIDAATITANCIGDSLQQAAVGLVAAAEGSTTTLSMSTMTTSSTLLCLKTSLAVAPSPPAAEV